MLREAALSVGHRGAHDRAALGSGPGAGGIYRLLEGSARPAEAPLAVWVTAARGYVHSDVVSLLLGDGLDRQHTGVWQRELVLGPAPEYCLLGAGLPSGAHAQRLPHGWRAHSQPREPLSADVRTPVGAPLRGALGPSVEPTEDDR